MNGTNGAKQLIVVNIPANQRKTAYNIAAKAGVKISIHTRGNTASILIMLSKSVLECNLLNLPEEAHGVYRFFEEMRRRKFEYTLEVYTHDYKESKRRNERGLFDMKQMSL